MDSDGFFDRFVHPRLARVATVGGGLWMGSFVVAAVGLALRGMHRPTLGARLFFLSGLVGLVGVAILGGCLCWLGGVWLRRRVGRW